MQQMNMKARQRRRYKAIKRRRKRMLTRRIFILFLLAVVLYGVNKIIPFNAVRPDFISSFNLPFFNSPTQHPIDWHFYIYREPDFRAQRIARFNPQTVNIVNQNPDGWALIDTPAGEYWVYLRSNRQFISRRMGLFENIYASSTSGYIDAQVVEIFETEGNWLQISTQQGLRWVNLDFRPPTYNLDGMLARHGDNLSVYFENLETGFIYRYNASRVYFSASVPKAIYALYIYQRAERGEADLNSMHEYTCADIVGGSGIIHQNYAIGTAFSLRELLRLNISESDNVATLMLRRIKGIDGYKNFIRDIGGNPNNVGDRIMNSYLTANEAGLFAREIFAYIESGGRYSHEFKDHMLNNQFPFIVSDYPVASKTGWTSPTAWHDMAIVYAPSPYILVILSAREGWTDSDYADFYEISMAFQMFNDTWFTP